jgi:hypothetical protein
MKNAPVMQNRIAQETASLLKVDQKPFYFVSKTVVSAVLGQKCGSLGRLLLQGSLK